MRTVRATFAGVKHLFRRRYTLRYPEHHRELVGEGYQYDPKQSIGLPGYKGRHILYLDKCTGCQLCAIACENIAQAIEMVPLQEPRDWPQNKKGIFPQVDFGKCVFCGFCIDACPFYALYMTNDYELAAYDKESLIFTPEQLAVPVPPKPLKPVQFIPDEKRGAHHG